MQQLSLLSPPHVLHSRAEDFIPTLDDSSVSLFLLDPPYYGIVADSWDNQWRSPADYVDWLASLCGMALPKLTPTGSLVTFAGMGRHGIHPVFDVVARLERLCTFRDWITWQKRRAYGKSHAYLYCREEILWFSRSSEPRAVTFNIPYLAEKRGYAGFNPRYPAKSEFKRVSNVWTDIPELMRPERTAQKPEPLIGRLVETHSNKGDLVVDFFAGWGTTGVAALRRGRRFLGCEAIEKDAMAADARCRAVATGMGSSVHTATGGPST